MGYVDGVMKAEIDLDALHAKRLTLFGVSNKMRSAAEVAEGVRQGDVGRQRAVSGDGGYQAEHDGEARAHEAHRRNGPDDEADHRQVGDDLLGQAVAEVLVLRVGAHVGEREDGDGFRIRFRPFDFAQGLEPAERMDCFVAMLMGAELGIAPLQSLSNIDVIDGAARLVHATNCVGHGRCAAACPVALAWGGESELVDADVVAYVTGLAPPDTPRVEIPAAHHHVMVDQPLALVAALRGLLAAWPARQG